jgi:hypothetical protein
MEHVVEVEQEVAIITRKWDGKEHKPTLVISIDALAAILSHENAVISSADVAGLMGSLHTYAAKANQSEQHALDAWETEVEVMEEESEED